MTENKAREGDKRVKARGEVSETQPSQTEIEEQVADDTGSSERESDDQLDDDQPEAAPAAPAQIQTRRTQYMLAPQQLAGVQPLSADDVIRTLQSSPDIEIIRKIDPPRLLGLQSAGSSTGSIVIAKIEPNKAELLRASARGAIVLDTDAPLTFPFEPSRGLPTLPNPGVFVPTSVGFSTTFQVRGPSGPLADAEVNLFGSFFPAKGKTDADGIVTLNVVGESPATMRALYVKPKANHWESWLRDPEVSTTNVNSVTLKPLPISNDSGEAKPLGWGQRAMGFDRLPESFNGSGVKVAVIDSGAAQTTHPNLRHLGPGLSLIGGDPNAWIDDEIGHGSHCAGVIGGKVQAGQGGLMGFAPAAEIRVCRVFPGGRFSDLVGALDYCMENGVDIISMSLGGGSPSQILSDRILQARALGIACIVAAGNSAGPVQFPASLPTTLAVSAIGRFSEFPPDTFHSQQILEGFQGRQEFFPAGFSCFGPEVNVCGPGVAITSTVPPDGFAAWDGTSMATPHVAGLAALVLAHHPDFQSTSNGRTSARVDRLFEIIRASCQHLPFGEDRVGSGLPWAPKAVGLEAQPFEAGRVPPESLAALEKLIQILQSR